MAKYRLLTFEELKALESDFVQYLIVNGIDADTWEEVKQKEPEKAKKIMDLFSDVVFEKVMRDIRFLDFVSSEYIQAVQCLDDRMIMAAIKRTSTDIDLATDDLSAIDLDKVEVYKGEKDYQDDRQLTLFDLTEKGYKISEGQLFKQLILAIT